MFGTIALKLLIIAVLTSAAASCQTTILPAARTALSMAVHRAFPPKFAEIDHRRLTPAFSSWMFGDPVEPRGSRCSWSSAMRATATCSSWSVDGVGLMIAYYYGQTGFACVLYYRRYIFTSVKNFFLVGLLPLIGGLTLSFIFLWSIKDMTDPAYEDPPISWLGVSPVLWLGLGTLLAGIPLMYWWGSKDGAFFRVKPDPDRRATAAGGRRTPAATRRRGRTPMNTARTARGNVMADQIVVGFDDSDGSRARARSCDRDSRARGTTGSPSCSASSRRPCAPGARSTRRDVIESLGRDLLEQARARVAAAGIDVRG